MGVGPGICSSCHQRILWAVTEGGSSMPLDYGHHPDGTVILRYNHNDVPCCRVLSGEHPILPGEENMRRMTHFATCVKRPAPKTKTVTDGNAKTVGSRRRRHEAQPLPLDGLPANVIPLHQDTT